ncbi:helix-turn-helix transcriptional regulator [Actinophytocola sp.]|uniref:helix-turn-helix domain-containing protein n=1 Tax=Actinophytocola sp. TaxID=1872138 RepID=UPI002ED53B97
MPEEWSREHNVVMPTSAVVAAWELGLRLRERREHLSLSVGGAAKAVKMQQPNLSAVEAGKKKLTAANLTKLAKLYEIEPDEREALEALRIGADQRDWYHQYSWLFGEDFLRYLGLEHGADHLHTYQSAIVPGPLQTADYAAEIIRGGSPYVRLTEFEPRMEVRQVRQHRLIGQEPMRITALLAEAALRQRVGGTEVMRIQLDHLATIATEHQHIEIRVIPFSAGAHAALGAPFDVLSFASPRLPDLVWQETLATFAIIDKPVHAREYAVVLAEATQKALDAKASIALIRQISKDF